MGMAARLAEVDPSCLLRTNEAAGGGGEREIYRAEESDREREGESGAGLPSCSPSACLAAFAVSTTPYLACLLSCPTANSERVAHSVADATVKVEAIASI